MKFPDFRAGRECAVIWLRFQTSSIYVYFLGCHCLVILPCSLVSTSALSSVLPGNCYSLLLCAASSSDLLLFKWFALIFVCFLLWLISVTLSTPIVISLSLSLPSPPHPSPVTWPPPAHGDEWGHLRGRGWLELDADPGHLGPQVGASLRDLGALGRGRSGVLQVAASGQRWDPANRNSFVLNYGYFLFPLCHTR